MLNLYTQKTPRRRYLKCKYYKSVNILDNRDTGNEFGQLLEDNMKSIFLEKSYTKCGVKTIARLYSKQSKLNISLNQ